jgi:hypothetical protein
MRGGRKSPARQAGQRPPGVDIEGKESITAAINPALDLRLLSLVDPHGRGPNT